MPTQISLHAVVKSYGERLVFDTVTCAMSPGERTGIIGENGSGKSSLLRLLAGREQVDEGQITVTADGGVGYLAQDAPLPAQMSVQQVINNALADLRAIETRLRELEPLLAASDEQMLTEYGKLATVFELRGGYDADAQVDRALHGLGLTGLDRRRQLGSLSGGEQARLHLATVLAAGSEVLLLDEPTNHLDDNALGWLEDHLISRRGTSVIVSHDRVFLERVTTSLIEVDADRHALVRYGCGYAGYLSERAAARQRWDQAHQQWQAEVDRLEDVVATTARWVAPGRTMRDRNKMAYGRAAGRVQQSVASRVRNAEQRLRRLQEHPVPTPPAPLRFTSRLTTTEVSGTVLEATEVRVGNRLHPLSLAVRRGERLLVCGENGAGKSTLLRVLAGDLEPDAGLVLHHGRVGYLPQEVTFDRPEETLLAAFAQGRPGLLDDYISPLLSLNLFDRDRLTIPVGRLSTGQRRRLGLARLFSEPTDLLLLDEPTNHLSLGLVEELEAALEEYPGAVVMASHDRRLRQRWRGEARMMTAGVLQ